jgi:hypothetical protein
VAVRDWGAARAFAKLEQTRIKRYSLISCEDT